MADQKISEQPAADALGGTELVPVVQSGINKRSTPDAFRDRAIGSLGGLTAASALSGSEAIGVAQSGNPRRTTPDLIRDRAIASLGSLTAASALAGTETLGLAQSGNPRGISVDDLLKRDIVTIGVACSDETTDITAGAAKVTFRMPYAMTLTAVRASLTTAQATGSIFTVDINESGSSILSTKLTIDNTERTSTTAATPAAISDSSLADDAEITIDVDQIGATGARGLKVWLIGRRT